MTFFDKQVRVLGSLISGYPKIREGLRWLLTHIGILKLTKPDILIFSLRRSGSTWLMELLGSEPHLRFVNEPLGPKFCNKTGLHKAGISNGHKIIPRNEADVCFVMDLLKTPTMTRICGPYNPFSKTYHLWANRRVLKIIHASSLFPEIASEISRGNSVFLIRHPIPTILSMQSAGTYVHEAHEALEALKASGIELNEQIILYAEQLIAEGDELSLWALEWALEMYASWKAFDEGFFKPLIISYEELLLEPQKVISAVCNHCALEDKDRIVSSLKTPSSSTNKSKADHLYTSGATNLVRSWKNKIEEEDIARIFSVISTIGIDFYDAESFTPSVKYRIGII